MENYKEEEIYYARMKETERNTLSQTPIYNLWKRSNGTNLNTETYNNDTTLCFLECKTLRLRDIWIEY